MASGATTKCPNCGYENRARAVLCNLCKSVMPMALAAEQDRQKARWKPRSKVQKHIQRSTFYQEKIDNRRNTTALLVFMVLILTALGATISMAYAGDPVLGAGIAFIVALCMGGYAWTGGKKMILSMSGAKKVSHDNYPQLFNVVEEMKIASGLPMPEVYVIDTPALNAFATGRDPENSAVAVTKGLMARLDRDELQGVIAHEMSHIRNFDIRYAMIAAVLVGSVAMISDAFLRGGFRFRGGGKGGGPLVIVAILLAILAPISAWMLQMAISRQREFLADASAVELTRNPDGLASALHKITVDPAPLETSNRATQHLFIVNPVKNFSMKSGSMFATHPATEARINALRQMGATGKYDLDEPPPVPPVPEAS